jgi:beta-lactamase superfamily II metal-dependent hydrolase
MFTIHMLDAAQGDCLWVEFGDANAPKRILIDAGIAGTYTRQLRPKIEDVIEREGGLAFELFVVTHIDDDHIGGALRFLDEAGALGVEIGEVWFNGYDHLVRGFLGSEQGEKLSELIVRGGWNWNTSFDGKAVVVEDDGELPVVDVAGMQLTLLSPTWDKLEKLREAWDKELLEKNLVRGEMFSDDEAVLGKKGFLGEELDVLAAVEFEQDPRPANGSSIAFLAEYDGVRVLFGADAHPSVLLESAARAPFDGTPVPLHAFKLPHHGSRNNVSIEMLEMFPADHYLVSTDGSRHDHPDREAIARVVVSRGDREPCLHFNCASAFNEYWEDELRQRKNAYSAIFGAADAGLHVDLS